MANLTTLADALKVFYVGGANEQLNKKSVLYSKLVRSRQTDVGGKTYTVLHHTGRNTNAGQGFAAGGSFGTAGSQSWKSSVIPARYLRGAIEIEGPAIRAAKGGMTSFIEATKSEVDGVMNDFIRSINRQLNGNGTGWLGYSVAADDTTAALFDDNQGNAFIHLDAGGAYTLDLVDASDASTLLGTAIPYVVGAEGATSWSLGWASGTVSGSADGDWLVHTGTLGLELQGLDAIIDDGDPILPTGGLQGLAVATYGWWKAQEFSNSGTLRPLTFELMQKPLTKIDTNSAFSAQDIPFLLANGPIYDKYCALCRADKRHVNTMRLDGGQTSVDFNGYPLIIDPQAKMNQILYPNPKAIALFTSSDGIQWADFEDGQMFQKKPGSSSYSDAYQAYLVFYGNTACFARNASGKLSDIEQ